MKKFRVWDNTDKEYHFNDFGAFVSLKNMTLTACLDCVIEQYTGLKDSNGKEIFEGDIIQIPDNWDKFGFWSSVQGYVVFEDTMFKFVNMKNEDVKGHLYECNDGELEIIGNIHEKELV